MPILLLDIHWMSFNLALALIPVILALVISIVKPPILRLAIFIGWFVFLPNTLYLITDLRHWYKDANSISPFFLPFITTLYAMLPFLGVMTFIAALHPIAKSLNKLQGKQAAQLTIFFINLLVGIAIIMGIVERTNSWEIIINPVFVLQSFFNVVLQTRLFISALIWGIGANVLYFSLANILEKQPERTPGKSFKKRKNQ